MAQATRNGDVVTLTMSVEEALYVAAELSGGNSFFHGLPDVGEGPFGALVEELRVGAGRRSPRSASYASHRRVAEATRPKYDNVAGRRVADKVGFTAPEPTPAWVR
jgi:hypothetical protein